LRAGEATEESFIELVREYSDDYRGEEDPGMYADITRHSGFVRPFLEWAVDQSHSPGDVGIVETEFGFHIMFFSSFNYEGRNLRYSLAERDKSTTAFQEWLLEAREAITWNPTFFSRLVSEH